jgi:FdhE protein
VVPGLEGVEPALRELPPAEQAHLVNAWLTDDVDAVYDLALATHVSPELLYFAGQMAVRPFLWSYARRTAPEEPAVWDSGGRCPVCGRRAHMGHIDGDNAKHLHCPACETVWRVARVGCPFCGCTDPKQVGFLTVEGDPEHRVEYCTECGGYLKVIDQRVRGRAVDYFLEDAATAPLDELALAEGFHR